MGHGWTAEMRILKWEEVKKMHENGELAGCYKLYHGCTEAEISSDYEWSEIEQHHEKGGQFGEELPMVQLNLPDGKVLMAPEVVDISAPDALEELEYSVWGTIEEYLEVLGIGTFDDKPDWATVKAVQESILTILSDAGVNFKILTDVQQEEIEKQIEEKQAEENAKVKAELEIILTTRDIDDIMCGAVEGGINYWCDEVKVVGNYLGEYGSDQISRGGQLILHDFEAEENYILDKKKFLKGVKMYFQNPHPYDILEERDNKLRIDTCNADATVCDMIIQYALFNDVIYG